MSFKVVVLGSSGGYAGAGKACSGYLLQYADRSLTLDLGAGALSNLLKYIGPNELEGLAISHMHYDHYMDIYGLLTARRFWEVTLPPLPVLVPPGAGESIGRVISESSRPVFMECLDVLEISEEGSLDLGGFEILARPVQHIEGSYAFRVTVDGRTLCYSGDSERCDNLIELARDADLFLCEATFTSEIPVRLPNHLTGKEAGEIAAEAGVGRLVLTHLWPTLDPEKAVEDARQSYDGPIELAEEGLTMYVGPYPCAT